MMERVWYAGRAVGRLKLTGSDLITHHKDPSVYAGYAGQMDDEPF